jgi:hypothetical protein
MADGTITPKLSIVPPGGDFADIENLWISPMHGDGITSPGVLRIPVGKPDKYNFVRAHRGADYRRHAVMIPIKEREGFDETFYLVSPPLARELELDGRPYVLSLLVDRVGNLRIWPIRLAAENEKDNAWWETGRAAVRRALDAWVRVIPGKTGYHTIDANEGFAPEPAWDKVKSFNELIQIAFAPQGIIKDLDHPVVRDLFGKAQRGD